ncbi:hypothetical protein DXG01_012386 [Tephrocybe rancida]|nr:hypothetical protein DXG01_012386 [Tephrocybe rancida]
MPMSTAGGARPAAYYVWVLLWETVYSGKHHMQLFYAFGHTCDLISTSLQCGTLFYVARGIIEDVTEKAGGDNPASGAPKPGGARPVVPDKHPREDLDESHFLYFRRFRVLLEEVMTMAADLANNGAEESQDFEDVGSDDGSGIESYIDFRNSSSDIEDEGSDDGSISDSDLEYQHELRFF